MGDADVYYGNQDIHRVIEAGVFKGPRITGAAHYLSITGGGGDVNYLSPEQAILADGLIVDGADAVRKAIREEIKYGSDWIKLLVTGAFHSRRMPKLGRMRYALGEVLCSKRLQLFGTILR